MPLLARKPASVVKSHTCQGRTGVPTGNDESQLGGRITQQSNVCGTGSLTTSQSGMVANFFVYPDREYLSKKEVIKCVEERKFYLIVLHVWYKLVTQ